MNAWGVVPLFQLAGAIHTMHADRPLPSNHGPPDSDLDAVAPTDTDQIETNVGILAFPPRADMLRAIVGLLLDGPRSSRELEDILAKRFSVTKKMRSATQRSGNPAWRNHVSFALVDLGKNKRGTGEIERIAGKRAPDGGHMGIYRLMSASPARRPLKRPVRH
jgi:hypothetical protein